MNKLIISALSTALLFSCSGQKENTPIKAPQLIPIPQQIELGTHRVKLSEQIAVKTPKEWESISKQLIQFGTRFHFPINKDINGNFKIEFILSKQKLGEEGYLLTLSDQGFKVEASHYSGAYNGMQSIKQMLLLNHNQMLSEVTLKDTPRFSHRGLMLDCSRHFWTVNELKKSIDQMSLFKLNSLHLHLTDNNGWRVEIKSWPLLTTKGNHFPDFPSLSEKYYTQDDLKELVQYAHQRNVEIIPEIDVPGHAMSILAAYPELSCRGGEFHAWPEERPLSERKRGNENMLCIGNPTIYQFMDDVLKELSTIFPSNYIHLGGDEVSSAIWKTCPKCKKMYTQNHMKNWGELQDHFTRKMSTLAQKYGKTMLGWDEINDRGAATTKDKIVVWRGNGVDQICEATSKGIHVISAPQHGCYFDWGYAGNSTRKVYEWDPVPQKIRGTEQAQLIDGAQACLWTERVPNQNRVERMLYPRLTALAEVMWSSADKRNWDDYYQRLKAFYPIFEAYDIHYYQDDAINEKEFKPSEEKPSLIRHAFITTNIPASGNYHPEYAFDGRSNTFFWGGRTITKGDYFQVELGEIMNPKKIEIFTGDSKDYIKYADIMLSADGKNFEKATSLNNEGEASISLDGNQPIKVIRIEVTKEHTNWPVIREIKVEE